MQCYCRLCAEQKNSDQFIHLNNNKRIYDEIIEKLYYVNADFVNFFNYDSPLPMSVCVNCYQSLNETYDFITKIMKAQEVLANILITERNIYLESAPLKSEVNSQFTVSLKRTEYNSNQNPDSKDEIFDSVASDNEFDSLNQTVADHSNNQNVSEEGMHEMPILSAFKHYMQKVNGIGVKNEKSWCNFVWNCTFCDMQFMSVELLRSHSKERHKKCAAFSCVDCTFLKQDVDFETFVSHVKIHYIGLSNYCHYCNICIIDGLKLEDHVKTHFSNTHIPCKQCGEILDGKKSLLHHTKFYNKSLKKKRKIGKKHTNSKQDLTCSLCLKVYKSRHTLKYHIMRHRNDRKRDFVCDECGKAFYNLDMLKVHIMTHDKSNPQTCTICHKIYNNTDCLKRHIRHMHTEGKKKEYLCDRCDKIFHDKRGLIRHVMSHDNHRPHACTICNRSFMFSKELSNHVAIHSGVKPFSCEQCGKHFRLQRHLNSHKIIHTDSMPFACQYCNKTFRFKQILKSHEHQHTGLKPYTCIECGMQFTNWSNYNKHMKRRHNIDTSKKKITPEGVFPIDPETGQLIQMHRPITKNNDNSSVQMSKIVKIVTA